MLLNLKNDKNSIFKPYINRNYLITADINNNSNFIIVKRVLIKRKKREKI